MEGCSLIPGQIVDEPGPHHYLNDIANWTNHRRVAFYPEKFEWRTITDIAFHMIFDDLHVGRPNSYWLLTNYYTQIGLACNCHPTMGEMCILELGYEVVPKQPLSHNIPVSELEENSWAPLDENAYAFTEDYPDEELYDFCRQEMPDYRLCVLYYDDYFDRRNLAATEEFMLPEFRMPNDPMCPND